MKSLVCLAELAVVILCGVYNRVAGEQRGKYEKKKKKKKKEEEPEPHKVLVTIASLSISRKLARQELRSKGSERLCHLP